MLADYEARYGLASSLARKLFSFCSGFDLPYQVALVPFIQHASGASSVVGQSRNEIPHLRFLSVQ